MRRLVIYLLFNLPLLLVACTFMLEEPSGITKEITPIKSNGSISLTDYIDEDTIYLFNTETFTFEIKNDLNGSQFQGEAYIDDILFHQFKVRQGQFSIPDIYFKTGVHKLRLSFIEPLDDQSLITKFKDLQATVFKEWVLVIDLEPPPNFEITASLDNGYLKYTWPEYKKPNFIDYEVSIRSNNRSTGFIIKDPSKNFVIDSAYIDGGSESTVHVKITTVRGDTDGYKTVNEPPIKLSMVFHPEDTTAHFVWSKPKYYGVFQSYTISDNVATLATVNVASDTTFNLKVDGAFPNVTRFYFRMLDKFGTEIFETEESIDFFIGNAMPTSVYATSWYYSKAANKFIARNATTISIYDESFNFITSRTIEGNMFSKIIVAWPGNFLHYLGTSYTISQLNLVNNTETSMSIPGEYLPQAYIGSLSGANNQIVSFHASDNDHVHPSKEIVGLANMENSTILYQENSYDMTNLSDDGRYSVGWPQVYSVSGGIQTNIGTIPNNYSFRWFRGDNTNEIITIQSNGNTELKTVIIGSSDMSILRTFETPEPGFFLTSYDPATQTLLYTKFGATRVYLVNIETGAKKVFKAIGSYNISLVNGTIIIGDRYIKAL